MPLYVEQDQSFLT